MKRFKIMLGVLWVLFGLCNIAQVTNPVAPAEEEEENIADDMPPAAALPPLLPFGQPLATNESLVGLKYEALELDEVLKQYSEWTGLALMKAPDVPAVKITLKCPKRLPKREALLAIEGILGMNGVALVPMGAKFLKVVPIAAARQYGMETGSGAIDAGITDTDKLVSRIVELKHIDIATAQGVIQNLLHGYGKIMPLERVNCILITDTAINIKRALEILALIDQPIEMREELRIFPITYAKASDIMSKIEAILADAQARDTKTQQIRQQLLSAPRMPLQPGQPLQPGTTPAVLGQTTTTQPATERGIIQGKVKMVADDRTNGLIIITRPEHFRFIEKIIKALDCSVEPDVTIKVFSLEYANAKDVVSLLTSMVSASSAAKSSPSSAKTAQREPSALDMMTSSFGTPPSKEGSKTATTGESGDIQISGKLSSEVKIIADPRTNALLIMATKKDMATIEELLEQIDISLSQVLIEVIIIEVILKDQIKMGVDWLQKSMIAYNEKQGGGRRAFLGFSGASMQSTAGQIVDATAITDPSKNIAAAGSGLTYYFSIFDLNIDAVINMLQTSSDSRILSTPIILTTDNKEARIMIGEKRPIVTSTSITTGGYQQSGYEYKDIGIELKVTPHINKKGFVVMEVSQKVNNVGGTTKIDNNEVPIITTREFGASISVNDRRTIVLGGLVATDKTVGEEKIPFLGDIPLLGRLFRYEKDEDNRVELMVMMTPYVLNSTHDVYKETARRFDALKKADDLLRKDWSDTELGKRPTAEQLREVDREQERETLENKASEKELRREAKQAERKAEREARKIKIQSGNAAAATAPPDTTSAADGASTNPAPATAP